MPRDNAPVHEGPPPADWIELRPDSDGNFDEIVATFADGMVHVETMNDNSVCIGFHKGNGPAAHGLQLWIGSNGKLRYNHATMMPDGRTEKSNEE